MGERIGLPTGRGQAALCSSVEKVGINRRSRHDLRPLPEHRLVTKQNQGKETKTKTRTGNKDMQKKDHGQRESVLPGFCITSASLCLGLFAWIMNSRASIGAAGRWGAQVPSLVGKLRSCMFCGEVKKLKNKNYPKLIIIT